MPSLQVEIPPSCTPIALDETKNFLRVEIDDDDDLIEGLIEAAVEACEVFTMRSFIQKGYIQTLDSFPYFADTQLSQNAMPPSYYSLPLYSTTLWNYSQQIKLFRPPLISVDALMYMSSADSQWHALVPVPNVWYPLRKYTAGEAISNQVADGNGNIQQCTEAGQAGVNPPVWSLLVGGFTVEASGLTWENLGPIPIQSPIVGGSQGRQFGAFIIDTNSEPARLFPGPAGNYWPPVLYLPNAVQIHFTSGFGPNADAVPGAIRTALFQHVADCYENRTPVEKASQTLPGHVKALLWPWKVMDICPTRG